LRFDFITKKLSRKPNVGDFQNPSHLLATPNQLLKDMFDFKNRTYQGILTKKRLNTTTVALRRFK